MSAPFPTAGGFEAQHRALRGVEIDFAAFDPSAHDRDLLARAQEVWAERARAELRSLQIVTRFLTELTGAGEAPEIYAGAVELIADEARHVGLCVDLCRAMGGAPTLPDPPALMDPPEFLEAPWAQRALGTAITMLLINETISVAYLEDLAARCGDPVVGPVLAATVADEASHDQFGVDYVRYALGRFAPATRPRWRDLAAAALRRHHAWAASVPAAPLVPEPELAALGLFSAGRQAAVFRRTWRELLGPRLTALGLV